MLKAYAILEKGNPLDQRAIYRSARRLALLFDSLSQSEEAIDFYQKAIAAGTEIESIYVFRYRNYAKQRRPHFA